MSQRKPQPQAQPQAQVPTPDSRLMTYKMSTEFSDWLQALADDVGLPVTNTVDLALREFAEKRRFGAMPRRYPRGTRVDARTRTAGRPGSAA